ncbi:hypothetical protein UA08_04861 [Talaromyces atroroseus]|uniref:NADP-dependent oxidoreductase domain-containing protein n=1 Tax=Talaromyces atroroseus TaxID=1441469 RepID=A0A225AWE4_TALAT|nr:hypothetical protein UA08_04861 [Talaromyces atroroseus]OKL59939.1 hypothetical protein UA08_04861 [Talaromyces atroroseus]
MPAKCLTLRPTGLDTTPSVMPTLIYGTAWKKESTTPCVYTALKTGFRAVDTAAQPRHYREDLVGAAMRRAIAENIVKREDLYIQTKYTPVTSQDPNNMPYDAHLSISDQVKASINSSLVNFCASEAETREGSYIDTLVLHTPLPTIEQTIEAWTTAESFVPNSIRNLGISNCTLPVLKALCASPKLKIKPAVVQNRFVQDPYDYDVELRSFARENDIIYQSFWTLTANPDLVKSEPVQHLSTKTGISNAAALYAFVLSLGGTSILDGTKSQIHMQVDLAAVSTVEKFSQEHQQDWQGLLSSFKRLIGEKA